MDLWLYILLFVVFLLLRVPVAEVLRLAVSAAVPAALGPAALLSTAVGLPALRSAVRLLSPVLRLRWRGRVAVRLLPASPGGLLPTSLGGLSVRRLLLRSPLRGTVVPAPASDPESSHVIERTWSWRTVCEGRGNGPGIGSEL